MKRVDIYIKPTQIIVLGFILIIFIGAFFLTLPFSSANGRSVDFIDALFTATSAVCVTGLSTLNTFSQWTVFGKTVIIVLIQVGGLGFMSFITMIMLLLRKKITMKERVILKESFNLNSFHGIIIFLKKIILGTIFIEISGGILLSVVFIPKYGYLTGIAYGMFHSVSAFCNAGFDIIGDSSVCDYSADVFFNIVIMLLIISGGVGFTVWIDVFDAITALFRKNRNSLKMIIMRFSLHTKLVLVVSGVLIFSGWILLFLIEYSNPDTIGNFSLGHKLIASLFQSVSLRTAGFASVPQGSLTDAGKMIGIILMAIGGSPGGTAGGIKTVTVGVIIISVISVVKGRNNMVAFKRTISLNVLQKSLTIVIMVLLGIITSTILLSLTEKSSGYSFIDILYEATSAMATVGFTAGLTPVLTVWGKIIIMVCMFIGRLGPITVAVALASNSDRGNSIEYPEGKILVG